MMKYTEPLKSELIRAVDYLDLFESDKKLVLAQ